MEIRKATMRDIPKLIELINGYASLGIMLPRTELEMAEDIRDFTVAEADGRLVACGALHFYTRASAEVRSLAVDDSMKGKGIGRALLAELETEARECELETLFAFTYVPDFFRNLGFLEVDRGELPLKAWRDCMRCPKFQCCDELAMVKYLHGRDAALAASRRETAVERTDPSAVLVNLPIVKS